MKRYSIIFILICGCYFSSCAVNSTDTELPSTTLTLPATTDTNYLLSGNPIPITAHFADNIDLATYTMRINPQAIVGSNWDTALTQNIMGENSTVNTQIFVPTTALSGIYHFHIHCSDAANHSSDSLQAIFQIQNSTDTIPPAIDVLIPNTSAVTVFGNGNLVVIAQLSDNDNLHSYFVQLHKHNNAANIYQTIPFQLDSTAHNLQEVIPLPATSGNYNLDIIARDQVNNTRKSTLAITIL